MDFHYRPSKRSILVLFMTPLPYTMIEATLSYLAWFSVVLFQAIVHFWILDSRKRMDEDCVPLSADNNDTFESISDPQQIEGKTEDDPIPHMVPHTPVSEDEEDDESFDGDEPKVFFELLELTGSEMMKSCSSLENLVYEQIIKVDAMTDETT